MQALRPRQAETNATGNETQYLDLANWHSEVFVQDFIIYRESLSVQNLVLKKDYWVRIPDSCFQEPSGVLCIIWRQNLPPHHSQ